MTINKFQGKTEEEAIEKAKSEMGPGVVIMNVKLVKPTGLFGFLKTPHYEVTAAMEEKDPQLTPASALKASMRMHESINLAADEDISLPKLEKEPPVIKKQTVRPVASQPETVEGPKVSASNPASEGIEERLVNLQTLLEQKLSPDNAKADQEQPELKDLVPVETPTHQDQSVSFLKMMYQTLLDNEVD